MSDGVQEDGLARPSVLKTKAIYIIATEFCERLAYYGFAGSLVLFFETVLKLSNEDSVNQFYIWNGFVYMTPLIGGYVADTYWSRYRTIQVFAAMYLIGLIMFNIGTIPGTNSVALVFLAIYIIALGAGGIKPNVSTLGADQFEVLKYDQDLKESKKFFSWFYWVINLGALVSYTIIGFCCQYGVPFLGGRDWGFFVGMLIATIAMALGLGAFMSGSQSYTIKQPEGSMLSTFIGILRQAIGNKSANSSRSTASTALLSGDDGSEKGGGGGGNDSSGQSLWQKNALPPSWLDAASTTNGGTYSPAFIESAKYVARLVPFLGVMIPFWGIYGQTKTAFQIQGCQMDLDVGGLSLPVSAMNIFNNISILVLVPIFEAYLYPCLKRWRGRDVVMLEKIMWGFIFAALAMIMASLIEVYRKEEAPDKCDWRDDGCSDNMTPCRSSDDYDGDRYRKWYDGDNDIDEPANCHHTCEDKDSDGKLLLSCIKCDDMPQMSSISIFWQAPQFILIGISEIFASITGLEFFYSQAPSEMRSVSQASNLVTNAIGSWLTIPLTLAVNANRSQPWIGDDMDTSHIDWYFYLLAGLMFATCVLFRQLSASYQYVDESVLSAISDDIRCQKDVNKEDRAKDYPSTQSTDGDLTNPLLKDS